MNAATLAVMIAFAGLSIQPRAQSARTAPAPPEPGQLTLHGVSASSVTHEGRPALRLVESATRGGGGLAVVSGASMQDGEIALDVAGRRGPDAAPDDRGFVGIAFRVTADATRYESFYLRPDNGRADNQVRRNHSAQYVSHPEFPWQVLRKSFPERYESYVDLQPGVWTPMRVVVNGTSARLFVHGSAQPTLVVNDVKRPPAPGGIALWIGPGTEAFFANLRMTPAAVPPADPR